MIYEDFGISPREDDVAKEGTPNGSIDEDVVCANIVLRLGFEGRGTSESAAQDPSPEPARSKSILER
ncbi:hypothetical protein PF003_g24713 [Phytophthora fragariae]|nr:hypothetical protein PF003_g24713 [Phytophthora fragariae]